MTNENWLTKKSIWNSVSLTDTGVDLSMISKYKIMGKLDSTRKADFFYNSVGRIASVR